MLKAKDIYYYVFHRFFYIPPPRVKTHGGYTLVEMAIVMAVIGTVAIGAISLGVARKEGAKLALTKERMDIIEQALLLHAEMSGYLPCPAPRDDTIGSTDFGDSADCSGALPLSGVVNAGTAGNNEVWIGAVPVHDLNLPERYMVDGWNRRFSYAIPRKLGEKNANTLSSYRYNGTDGVITMQDASGNQITDTSTDAVIAYLLLSYGKDGKASHSRNGTFSTTACTNDTVNATLDDENCDFNDTATPDNQDTTFIDTRISDGDVTANYYDDVVRWESLSAVRASNAYALEPFSINPQMMDGSSLHFCAIRDIDNAVCWGEASDGRLGDNNSITDRFIPENVRNPDDPGNTSGVLPNVAGITTGFDHSCAYDSDGVVYCWGNNDSDQLGRSGSSSNFPVEATEVSELNIDVMQIVAGNQYTCLLSSNGVVYCWGANNVGQLGRGMTSASESTPQTVGLTSVLHISAGEEHMCAVKTDGTVWCWGNGVSGRLGNNQTGNEASPVQVENNSVPGASYLPDVTEVASGGEFTCALKTDATVWCWGENGSGQLGDGTTSDKSYAVQVGIDPAGNLTSASAVDAGNAHACVVRNGGEVWCWGNKADGRFGNNTSSGTETMAVQTLFAAARSVHTAEKTTCIIETDGTAQCSGYDGEGQLGDNAGVTPTPDRYSPVDVNSAGYP